MPKKKRKPRKRLFGPPPPRLAYYVDDRQPAKDRDLSATLRNAWAIDSWWAPGVEPLL